MPLMGTAEERVTELEDRSVTIFQTTCKYKKSGKTKQSIPELWDNLKRYNIHVMRISEGEEKMVGKVYGQELSKHNEKYQITEPGNSENTEQNK